MVSRQIEDFHKDMLEKLFKEQGLVCRRTASASTKSSPDSIEEEEEIEEEQAENENVGGAPESYEFKGEALREEEPEFFFPTPSLRHVWPDDIRKIQQQDRIRVLPDVFKTDINPEEIPVIERTMPKDYIDKLATITGCKNYSSSFAEFWFLDTLANLLRRAQADELGGNAQAMLILWFCEWMKEIQYFDAADRQRMIRRFKRNMIRAAVFISEEECLPTPMDAGVDYRMIDEAFEDERLARLEEIREKMKKSTTGFVAGRGYDCALTDLSHILHYIFDLFSTDYQYDLIRSVFTETPEYCRIDAPYTIHTPKKFFVPLKPKAKEAKAAKPKDDAKGKGHHTAKGKPKEIETMEYINLMLLKAHDMREQEIQEEKDREDYNRRSHILPLGFAEDVEDLFNLYWPLEDEEKDEQSTVVSKDKGKGKKK